MAGQTISDRLLAAKHSIAGQGLAKSVCKATTEELLAPKKKHLDYLIHCTNEPNVSIPQLANLLVERSQNTNWVVVFKSLITVHHLLCYGNERFTQYLASSNSTFQLSNFLDKSGPQGYDMSPFIRRYARYLNEKALSYRTVAFDFCKVKRGKEDGVLRTMNADKLLKTLPVLQSQLDALLEFDCTAADLSNSVINMTFMLLFRDLIRLFAGYNDSIINLLEKYFDMNKKQCREALDLYKKFLIRMDRVAEFLKVAENVGIDKGEIPDLTKAPSSLLDALEQHLATLEGKKAVSTPTQAAVTQQRSDVKTGVNALSSTSSAFGTAAQQADVVDESIAKQIVAEEEAILNQYKAKLQSPVSGGSSLSTTNPFLAASPTQPIVDLFSGPPQTNATSNSQSGKAMDDLLQLGNPFADTFTSQSANATTTLPVSAQNGVKCTPVSNAWMTNGFSSGNSLTNAFVDDNSFNSVFGDVNHTASVSACSAATAMGMQAGIAQATATSAATNKVLTGDLDSSLASLAENLTIDKTAQPKQMQWNSPKNAIKTGSQPNMWTPQPMAATTGANYRPMGIPPSNMATTFPTGYPQMGVPTVAPMAGSRMPTAQQVAGGMAPGMVLMGGTAMTQAQPTAPVTSAAIPSQGTQLDPFGAF